MKQVFKKGRRFLASILLAAMVLGMMPMSAFASTVWMTSVTDHWTNQGLADSGLKFYEHYYNGTGNGFQKNPVDAASGAIMYCVDPGKGVADWSEYTVASSSDLGWDALIDKARSGSKLGNVSSTGTASAGMEFEEALSRVSTSDLERMYQMMSIVHMHRNDPDSRTYAGVTSDLIGGYHTYMVYAVQNYIWYLTRNEPSKYGLWYKISTLGEYEQQKVKACYYAILEECDRLYNGAGKIYLDNKQSTQSTFDKAAQFSIDASEVTSFQVDSGESLAAFQNIKYISIENGPVKNFASGDIASSEDGLFSITNTGSGISVELAQEDSKYTVQFLTSPNKDAASGDNGSDWAIYAEGRSAAQAFFTAYVAPGGGNMFMSFNNQNVPNTPIFPGFSFEQHKLDSEVGFDSDDCTPVGDTKLDATFELNYRTDCGASGTVYDTADTYGHGASETIFPWGDMNYMPGVVNYQEETSTWTDPDAGEDAEPIEFVSKITYSGSCDVTISESEAPEGHHGTNESYSHTITYKAVTERSTPYESFSEMEYTIMVDGKDTGMKTGAAVAASWDAPYTCPSEDVFENDSWKGILQIIKAKEDDDIFSSDDGHGTVAGGTGSGREYSTDSKWTLRILDKTVYSSKDPDAASEKFSGYEDCPYVKVVEDTAMQKTGIGELMHCYKVMLNGTGTPADEENPLTPSEFGQIYISNLPYGTYLLTEIKADGDRYVTESMYITISRDKQIVSTDIVNTSKRNVVKVVKVDSETGKTVPSASTAFRIRYMGSPEYQDPTKTPNYGRYLPNATNINASVTSPEDYIFYTDAAGEVTIPYELEYGSYQLEEIVVPEGYYIGVYGEDGVAQTAPAPENRKGESYAVYDNAGNKIDYTKNENIVYNYYPFAVTEQDAHVDGNGYITYYLTVEMANTASKGKVEISKLGEKLVGFRETTDAYGNTVCEPVYESFPLKNVTFGIYAAEDILLEDGEEAPIAYDKLTGEEIALVTDVLNHIQFPNAEIVRSGKHELTGAEVVYTRQRDKSENNYSTVDYLTPVQKGTKYEVSFSRYDKEKKLTYDYQVEFALEYTAGGWNYTDIHVKRTLTSDDYTPVISDELPDIYNGKQKVAYSSTVFDNKNKLSLNKDVVNEYDMEANHFTANLYGANQELLRPEIADLNDPDNLVEMPELPEGYSLSYISSMGIFAVNDRDVNDLKVAIHNPDYDEEKKDEQPDILPVIWESTKTADKELYFAPQYKAEAVENLPELPVGATFLYATSSAIYVQVKNAVKALYLDKDGKLLMLAEDGSDVTDNAPKNIPDGYTYEKLSGMIMAYRENDDGSTDYKLYIHDEDKNTDRWVDCDEDGNTYKVRVQEIDLTLTQHNTSEDGWRFEMDGLILDNAATNEDTATAVITLPYNAKPVISDSVGCEVSNRELNPGTQTTIVVHHPDAPVFFKMIDGSEAEMVFLGGYTKTTLTVPASCELPVIQKYEQNKSGSYVLKSLDYFNEAAGGLTPDNNKHEINIDEYNYIRVKRCEADDTHKETYYVIDIVSNATDVHDAFVVNYHGSFESTSLVITDAATGAQRGNLCLFSIDKTMRYPLSDLVEKITTDENGIATSSALPLGDYIIRELEAPDEFVKSNHSYPFSLNYKDQFTPLVWTAVEAENGAVNIQLDITKGFQTALNSDKYEPKAGAVFGVYAYNPIYSTANASNTESITTGFVEKDTLVATITTDENGKAVESIKLPMGDYYVQEISTLDGYAVNGTKFIFRADDSVKSGDLVFKDEDNGMEGKIVHSGYKTADIEIVTYTQIPVPHMTINDITYSTDKPLAEKTVGNNVLLENKVDGDRSTFRITGTVDKPVAIQFESGAKLIVTIGESTYEAQFIDENGNVTVYTDSSAITEKESDSGKTYVYNPLVAFTGYTAQTSMIYTAPQTRLESSNHTTVEFAYDMLTGVKKAVIKYPDAYKYYDDKDLPTRDTKYLLGDINMDGELNEADTELLRGYVDEGKVLSDNQKLLADANGDSRVNARDLDALAALIADVSSRKEVTVKIPYLPQNAIVFETDGLGNNAYAGSAVDKEARTIIVDLSKLTQTRTVTVGKAVITLTGDTIKLDGETTTAKNTKSGKTVLSGYQPDSLMFKDGNTLVSSNRVIALSSFKESANVALTLNYDHSFMDIAVTKGSVASAWFNGEAKSADEINGLRMPAGSAATLVFSDSSVYRIEISNTGYVTMSVEGLVNGAIDYEKDIPTVTVNGSADGFIDAKGAVIKQTMPMDETSTDDIHQFNVKNTTLARSDGFVKQLQVKINASDKAPEETPVQPGKPDIEKPSDTETIKNDVNKMYISKTDVTTGKVLSGAKISIYDSTGKVIVSGRTDKDGRLNFEKPAPGTYTFKEISAPAGYKLNVEIFEFTVHPDGTVTGDNTITDEPDKPDNPHTPHTPNTPTMVLNKTDATTAKGIPGAKIEVLREDKKTVVASGYSDKNGQFRFDRPADGVYYFHEVVAPNGWVLNEELFSFTVKNGKVTGDDTITDERTKVIISKVDVTTSDAVPGATIEVMDKDGNIIASGLSDENGYFGFYRPDPGVYYFHEVVAPDGYILNEELFSFEVTEDFDIIGDNTITNVPNTVIIKKEEPWSTRPIEGATVEFWDEDGKLIQVGITDSDGIVYFAAPKLGTYIYRESIAPEGYILDEGTHVITIHPDGTITGEKRFTNTPYIPRTGIVDFSVIWFSIAGLALVLLVGISLSDKKRRNARQ